MKNHYKLHKISKEYKYCPFCGERLIPEETPTQEEIEYKKHLDHLAFNAINNFPLCFGKQNRYSNIVTCNDCNYRLDCMLQSNQLK